MVAALLDVLHDKGILTKDEARTVLTNALTTVGALSQAPEAYGAAGFLSSMLKNKFPGR